MKFLNDLVVDVLKWSGVLKINNLTTGNIVDFQVNSVTRASVDTNGKYTGTVDWANVNGKPSSFDPNVHTHDDRYYTEAETNTLLNARAASSHTHGNITNAGAIGTTANLNVRTGASGVLEAMAAGTTAQYLRGDGAWATPPDTTYAEITTAEIDAGNGTTLRSISGQRVKYIQDNTLRFQAGTTAPTNTRLLWVDTN